MSKYSMISRLQEEKKNEMAVSFTCTETTQYVYYNFFIVNKVKSLKKDPDC